MKTSLFANCRHSHVSLPLLVDQRQALLLTWWSKWPSSAVTGCIKGSMDLETEKADLVMEKVDLVTEKLPARPMYFQRLELTPSTSKSFYPARYVSEFECQTSRQCANAVEPPLMWPLLGPIHCALIRGASLF